MKKVLAAVLSLIMVLSFTSVAFAADMVPGKVFCGFMEDVNANPGDTVTLDVKLVADANENDGFDKNGTLVIPLWLVAGSDMLEFVDFQLSEEAIGAGATLNDDSENYILDLGELWGAEIRIPSIYLFSTDMTIAQLTVKVSEDWQVVDYQADDLTVIVADNETYGADLPYVETEEGEWQYLETQYTTVSGNIVYQYQASASERLIEKLKEIGRTIIDLLTKGLGYLMGMLKPADWNKGPAA